jgi:hypothetical protein
MVSVNLEPRANAFQKPATSFQSAITSKAAAMKRPLE